MNQLSAVYIAMLNNISDIQDRLSVHLPKIAEHAGGPALTKLLKDRIEDAARQKLRIRKILGTHGESPTFEKDLGFETMMLDALTDLSLIEDPEVRDAFITAAIDTAARISLSRYTTLITWAARLRDDPAITLLRESLREEEDALAGCASLSAAI